MGGFLVARIAENHLHLTETGRSRPLFAQTDCLGDVGPLDALSHLGGDTKGAPEAYTRSLEIEWNQPLISEAKSRLLLRVKN